MATQRLRYVNTDNVGAIDGLTKATGYVSLQAAMVAEAAAVPDLVASGIYLTVMCSGATLDQVEFHIAGFTVDIDHYIEIIGDWDGTKYDATKYHSGKDADYFRPQIGASYTKISKMQFLSQGEGYLAIIADISYVTVFNCLFKGRVPDSYCKGFNMGSGGEFTTVYNCIFCDFNNGEDDTSLGLYDNYREGGLYYNNTFYNCYVGIRIDGSASEGVIPTLKNNLFYSCTQPVATGNNVHSGSDYNATDSVSIGYVVYGGAGGHDVVGATFTFTSTTVTTTGFLHLASNDTGAKTKGVDLSTVFTIDVDGETRPTGVNKWDIGADQSFASPTPNGPFPVFYYV